MNRKPQASLEFLVFLGIALVILIVFTIINLTYLKNNLKQREITGAQDLTKLVKNEINLASRVEPGYVRTVNLPVKLDNKDYAITTGAQLNSREISIFFINDNPRKDYTERLATNVKNILNINPVTASNNKITIRKCADDSVKAEQGDGTPC